MKIIVHKFSFQISNSSVCWSKDLCSNKKSRIFHWYAGNKLMQVGGILRRNYFGAAYDPKNGCKLDKTAGRRGQVSLSLRSKKVQLNKQNHGLFPHKSAAEEIAEPVPLPTWLYLALATCLVSILPYWGGLQENSTKSSSCSKMAGYMTCRFSGPTQMACSGEGGTNTADFHHVKACRIMHTLFLEISFHFLNNICCFNVSFLILLLYKDLKMLCLVL